MSPPDFRFLCAMRVLRFLNELIRPRHASLTFRMEESGPPSAVGPGSQLAMADTGLALFILMRTAQAVPYQVVDAGGIGRAFP